MSFHFDLHSFDIQDPALPYFVLTFAQFAREGIGPRRGRAELVSVEQLDLEGTVAGKIFDGQTFLREKSLPPAWVELDARGEPVSHARVRFLTPTELKSGRELALRPEFAILFARLRDRISTLRALYGAGPLEIDFRMTAERAARVRMLRCQLQWTAAERRSTRTGRVHPIGGFIGEADYEGELTEFMPYLQVARWTGVGRQTVWGKGEVQVY